MKIYNVSKKIDGLGNNDFDYEAVYNSGYSAGYDEGYSDGHRTCYIYEPLTFEFFDYGDIKWVLREAPVFTGARTIQYSKNDGDWEYVFPFPGEPPTISVAPGDKVCFKGDNDSYVDLYKVGDGKYIPVGCYFETSARCNVYGNIMSMIHSEDFSELDTFTKEYTFYGLFSGCTGLEKAENLLLPATSLTRACYASLFEGLANLKTGPELPALTMVNSCYHRMFYDCASLEVAPELPATVLAEGCYQYMFNGCSNLEAAPELPEATLAPACYYNMFARCRKLKYIKCLSNTNMTGISYTYFWVVDVHEPGTFVKRAGVEWSSGISGIPTGWTIVEV